MAPEYKADTVPPIDEITATQERRLAEQRCRDAESGAARTSEAVSTLRGLVQHGRELHEQNHYVQRLLPIFRGARYHAS